MSLVDKLVSRSNRAWFWLTLALLFLGVSAALAYFTFSDGWVDETDGRSLLQNFLFFLLINFIVAVIAILIFLLFKNLFTLFLERRRGILGSKLRSRLVGAFVALTLIPTVFLFFVAKGILDSVLERWFSAVIYETFDGAIDVARVHQETSQNELLRLTTVAALMLNPDVNLNAESVEPWRKKLGVPFLLFSDVSGHEIGRAIDGDVPAGASILAVNSDLVKAAARGESQVGVKVEGAGEYVQASVPLRSTVTPDDDTGSGGTVGPIRGVITALTPISPEFKSALNKVLGGYQEYSDLRTYRRVLRSGYFLLLIGGTLLLLFFALWTGFFLAKSLSVPIGQLANATAEVAAGNLNVQIPEVGDDELSVLTRSFNTMVNDLRSTTDELSARTEYLETLVANIGVGVLSLGDNLEIRSINFAAQEIFGLDRTRNYTGALAAEVLPAAVGELLVLLSERVWGRDIGLTEGSCVVQVQEEVKSLQLALSRLLGLEEQGVTMLLMVDDITNVVSGQRLEAWREVARRIAHEIKNPLTPIKLSAERMQKRLSEIASGAVSTDRESELKFFSQLVTVIVTQVELLRDLVNEFSRFARMPKVKKAPNSVSQLLNDTAVIYRSSHPQIELTVEVSANVPSFEFDRDQMLRVLINLIDNSLAAISERQQLNPEKGEVALRADYVQKLGLVVISVSDNGIGVADADKKQLFEPYFSKKSGGTGLGLTIASNIVSDHNGFIRVRDRKPFGAIFSVELPVA
jgi:two-component system nitrogen regulation sensor histidine kinase NtrY